MLWGWLSSAWSNHRRVSAYDPGLGATALLQTLINSLAFSPAQSQTEEVSPMARETERRELQDQEPAVRTRAWRKGRALPSQVTREGLLPGGAT